VVKIGEERGPAPVGGMNASQLPYFSKGSVGVVAPALAELEGIAHILGHITYFQGILKEIVIHGTCHLLFVEIVLGQHIQGDDVDEAIVVKIGQVVAHAEVAYVVKIGFGHFSKSTILVVDVQIIIGNKIVGHENIFPPILIDIAN